MNSTEFRERLVNAYSEVAYEDQLSTPISSNYISNNVTNEKTINTTEFIENAIISESYLKNNY